MFDWPFNKKYIQKYEDSQRILGDLETEMQRLREIAMNLCAEKLQLQAELAQARAQSLHLIQVLNSIQRQDDEQPRVH